MKERGGENAAQLRKRAGTDTVALQGVAKEKSVDQFDSPECQNADAEIFQTFPVGRGRMTETNIHGIWQDEVD